MVRYSIRFIILFGLILASTLLTGSVLAQQSGDRWQAPVRITELGNFAQYNSIVADSSGRLHAIWSESVDAADGTRTLDTVYYATWDDAGWSKPVDIFVTHPGAKVEAMRLRIDSLGFLHALWISEKLVYARAHVPQAMNVRAWEVVNLREPAFGADLAIDDTGHHLNIIYIIQQQSIQFIRSRDGGQSWTPPVTVWTPKSVETASEVRLEQDKDGTLHAAWGVETAARNWDPDRIGYAHSLDGGETWVDHYEVLEQSGQVSIGFDQEGGIHLFWNNPVWDDLGRFHMWSEDGGASWSPTERVFPGYKGMAKWPAMAQDSVGVLHLVFAANPPWASDPRIFHAYWQGNHWAEPETVQSNFERTEEPALAIRGGNELHVLWFSYTPKDYGIWHTWAKVEAPTIAFKAVPTPEASTTPIPTSTPAVEAQTEALSPSTPTPTIRVWSTEEAAVDTRGYGPAFPIVVGSVPVLALIALMVLVRTRL